MSGPTEDLIALPAAAVLLRLPYRRVHDQALAHRYGAPVQRDGRWFLPRAAVEAAAANASTTRTGTT